MENNHKIAEFMGLTWVEKSLVAPHGSESEINYKVYNDGVNNEIIHLKYDTSWDWLIPAITKLSKIYCYYDNESEFFEINQNQQFTNEEIDIIDDFIDGISWYVFKNDINKCYELTISIIDLHNSRKEK